MKVISPFWFMLYINTYHVTHINVFYIYNIYIYTYIQFWGGLLAPILDPTYTPSLVYTFAIHFHKR